MKYFSLNGHSAPASFREAAILGQAPDKGLYFPENIPTFKGGFIESLQKISVEEIAYEVIRPYVGDSIASSALQDIAAQTVNFPIPLVQVHERMHSLELYHGPTLAFKDVGARFMSRCLGYFTKDLNKEITVLVATSGDTGGAVANGFLGVEGVRVVILYPSGRVSKVQEQQLTALGQNVVALEVDGTFDDCQRMVKAAFADTALTQKLQLSSANSINIARWLPQQFYFLLAARQWSSAVAPVVCVPSGNFGNLAAGVLAWKSGMPVKRFIAACNVNDVVPAYLRTGKYVPVKAQATISNAMDVGDPSNWIRIEHLFEHDAEVIQRMLKGATITDETTKRTMERVYHEHTYTLDPHGAVAWSALENYLESSDGSEGYILETAHPVKFADIVEEILQREIALPSTLESLMSAAKKSIPTAATEQALFQTLHEL